ncbi:signal transduction histidine kinase [Nonomuraea thailandensis]|uniref:histidine kinase n=1 Tax=Nonomuraea thailandensis TaxID=1188745 RepID=A0A9X2K9J8_9ACTN|nr:histidine kinase [Nonomuraea thailandensis]MCP2364840.1 signal transduction histidine kinase [Nonomuraea thailandensis]
MQGLLRSLWDEPRPPQAPRRVWRDRALVGLLAVAIALEGVFRTDLQWRPISVIFAAAMLPTLLWRRTQPLLAVAIPVVLSTVVQLVTAADPAEMGSAAYILILLYALCRWGSGREAAAGLVLITVAVLAGVVSGHIHAGDVAGAFAVVFAGMTLGGTFRYRARARMRELDQVKLLEREQLARDLHDTVAHHVSAMAIRAQAGIATASADPAAAVDALRVIEAEASRTLAEMRTMVRVLRRDQGGSAPEMAPNPHLADLWELAGRGRVGPAVDVRIDGDLDGVPASVGAAIYRIAQESVTNARRHARHATRIEVRVAADDASVRLRVSDDGDSTAGRPVTASGYGLLGMIERAGLLGGTCEAGPNPGRGWTVTAELPRTGAST